MLLIIILLSTVLLTVALSVSQITTQETKISKLEEDSKRAFAAAEAGIEARLQSAGDVDISSLLQGGGVTGTATLTTTQTTSFYLPTPLERTGVNSQWTFYLTDYNKKTNTFTGNPLNGTSLTLYFGTTGATCGTNPNNVPNLEFTLIDAVNPVGFRRALASPCGSLGSTDLLVVENGPFNPSGAPPSVTFTHRTTLDSTSITNFELLIMRVIFGSGAPSTITTGVLIASSVNLPIQGSEITADAKTTTNVAKKIQLYQSYPQIPADLFVTSF